MLKKTLFGLAVATLMLGCVAAPSKQTSASVTKAQSEMIVPGDNASYFYADGFGDSQVTAQNDALAKIAARISVSVKSQSEANLSVTMKDGDETIDQTYRNQVLTQTQNIDFIGVEVFDQQTVGAQVQVLVRVNRPALVQHYRNKLNTAHGQLDNDFKLYKNTSLFEQLKNSRAVLNQSADLTSILSILQVLQPQFSEPKVTGLTQAIYQHMSEQKQNAVFVVAADANSQALAKLIEQQLTAENYKVAKTGNIKIQLTTNATPVSVRTTDARVASLKMVNRDTSMTVTDAQNRTVSKRNVKTRGVSPQSEQAAVQDTTPYSRLMGDKSIIDFISGQ